MNRFHRIKFNDVIQILLFIFMLILPLTTNAWINRQSISNKHFRIYYPDGWQDEAVKVIQTLEYYRPQVEKLTGGSKYHIPVMIEDMGNNVNGYTDILNTKIALFAYPPTSGELAAGEDWWQMVATHEYIHMLQMTRESGIPKLLRIGFSNIFYPLFMQPAWMTEGITVYGESQLSRYSGRLHGGTYHSVISALAHNDKLPSKTKASYFSFDTPHASYYVFGGAFFEYLSYYYGESKFAQLYDWMSSSTLAYMNSVTPIVNLDPAYSKTYGKSLDSLWSDWISYEKKQPYNLPERNITSDGWYKSNLQLADNYLYYVAGKAVKTGPNSSFFSNKLCRINVQKATAESRQSLGFLGSSPNKPEVIIEQNSEFPAGFFVQNEVLYYSRSELSRGYANNEMDGLGYKVQIIRQDLTGDNRRMLCEGQIRAFLPLPDGTLLVSEDNPTHTASTLYLLHPDTKLKEKYYESDILLHKILIKGSSLILGGKSAWQNCSIYSLDMRTKSLYPIIDTPFYEVPVSFFGDEIIFNAVYDGKMGAYIYNTNSNVCYKLSYISDIRTPVFMPDGSNQFISINANGYDVYQDNLTKVKFMLPLNETPPPPVRISHVSGYIPSQYGKRGKAGTYFANLGHFMVPRVLHLPIIEGQQDSMAIGASLSGSDAMGDFPFWSATVIYDTKFKKFKYDLATQNSFFRPVKHTIEYSNNDGKTLKSSQYISLYKRQNYGIQDVITGFSFNTKSDYQRKIWTPFIQMDLGWASGNLSARQFFPFETTTILPSDRNRKGWQSYMLLHQKLLLGSELKAIGLIAKDTKADSTEVFGSIRGYDNKFKANQGAVLQANFYKPIFKIREGIWNPQIYIEDVCLGLFYDAVLQNKSILTPLQSSQGIEAITELGFAFNFRLSMGIRYIYNKDKITTSEVFVNTLF